MIANFAVTYACNSRCSSCNIWRSEERTREELTLDQITDFFRDNKEILCNVKSIQVTGGEPFLRPDLVQVIEGIYRTIPGCMVWIPTNGLLPEKITDIVRQILTHFPRLNLGVSVSIDGIGVVHDESRGIRGSFRRAQVSLSQLSLLRARHSNLRVSVGFTLSPENVREAPLVQMMAYNKGADFSVRPVNTSEIYYDNVGLETLYDRETLISCLDILKKNAVKRNGLLNSVSFLRYVKGIDEYVSTQIKRTTPCSAGSDSFFLDPYGDVYPCIMMDTRLGNIREVSFREIWMSEKAVKTREMIRKLECPRCWVECEAYREIIKDRFGLGRLLIKELVGL